MATRRTIKSIVPFPIKPNVQRNIAMRAEPQDDIAKAIFIPYNRDTVRNERTYKVRSIPIQKKPSVVVFA
jgi:hypothetical protein